uniref:Glycosyltransferase family 2 protein n=1 Tax=Phenylobacterium glaciei TaxID=2803784 RepID=A0A974S8L5_9CAUL|nr:glycosyltransferase family 2 protein [Phenylobacterium glaciei]
MPPTESDAAMVQARSVRPLVAPSSAFPTLEGSGTWIIIPCYRVRDHILKVIAKIPSWCEGIICVDDGCPDKSGDFIEAAKADSRVAIVRLSKNRGVGGAVLAGYAEAIRRGARVLVKVDGDDQMDLGYIPTWWPPSCWARPTTPRATASPPSAT